MAVLHSLHHVSEEREGEEVVGHVPRIKQKSAVDAALLGSFQGDFAVLHHLIAAVHLTDNAYRLCGVGLLHHLEKQKTCEEAPLHKQTNRWFTSSQTRQLEHLAIFMAIFAYTGNEPS